MIRHPLQLLRMSLLCGGLGLGMVPDGVQAQVTLPAQRQAQLTHMVRQDCGSCHGMRLGGGLGPALTPQALQDKPDESLVATIVHGRPGTPMASWRSMLDEADAQWIVRHLKHGFPEETRP